MKIKTVITALMALSMLSGGSAFAQGNSHGKGNRHGQHANQCQDRNGHCPPGQDRRNNDGRKERGAGPNHSFYKGERLPMQYRGNQYVVDDWRGHRLSAPPRGYHWVQSGSDYLLVAIATGIILQLLLNN
jgi:Ni/Co efflux regulator RcnB